jgi:hypothetical protein
MDKYRKAALDYAQNTEIRALLQTSEAAAVAEETRKHDELADRLRASFDGRMNSALQRRDQDELGSLFDATTKLYTQSKHGSSNRLKWGEWRDRCKLKMYSLSRNAQRGGGREGGEGWWCRRWWCGTRRRRAADTLQFERGA